MSINKVAATGYFLKTTESNTFAKNNFTKIDLHPKNTLLENASSLDLFKSILTKVDFSLTPKLLPSKNINFLELLQLQKRMQETGLVVEMTTKICEGISSMMRKLQNQQ